MSTGPLELIDVKVLMDAYDTRSMRMGQAAEKARSSPHVSPGFAKRLEDEHERLFDIWCALTELQTAMEREAGETA